MWRKGGIHIFVAQNARCIAPGSIDLTVKNYHWGDLRVALFQAFDDGYDTIILLNEQNHVTEGLGFIIFASIEHKVVNSKSVMLEDISRKTVIEICEALDITC